MPTLFVLYAFLFFIVLVGCIGWRKHTTPDEFYVAGRKQGVVRTSASLLATILGSSAILGSVDMAYSKGWAGAWLMLCASIGLFALGSMTGTLKNFKGYHLPGLLEHFYGHAVKRCAAGIIAFAWLGVVAAQFIGAAKITQTILNVPYTHALLAIGTTVILYTAIGGQFSIIRTDFYQALLIVAGLLLVYLGLPAIPPGSGPVPALLSSHFGPWELLVLLLTYASTFVAGPDIYSRLFCAKDTPTARKALIITATTLIPIAGILAYIGVFASTSIPEDSGSVLFSVVRQEFSSPMVYLFYFSMLAAIMSSADTTLFTAGELLTQSIKEELNAPTTVSLTRGAILLLGVIAMAVAIACPSILGVFLTALTLYAGAFVVPVIAGMAGMRTQGRRVIMAMICGGTLALTGKLLPQYGNYLIVIAFVVNFMFLVGRQKG